MTVVALFAGAWGLLFSTGCASRSASSTPVISRSQVGTAYTPQAGTITEIQEIIIDGDPNTQVGTGVGAAAGGIAGSTVGSPGSDSSRIGSAVGVVGGAIIGAKVQKELARQRGVQITVEMDDGRERVIMQEADYPLRAGDRVQVLESGGRMIVRPLGSTFVDY